MARPAWAQAFLASLGEQPRGLLQLRVARLADGSYELRHRDDPPDLVAPPPDLADLARHHADGSYRNLPYAPDLRGGWVLSRLDADELLAALETLYPAALAHLHAEAAGTLHVVDWPELAKRQTGWQGLVKRLEPSDLAAAAIAFCSDDRCLRRVLWRVADERPLGGAGEVPCPEPCSLLLSFAQKAARLRRGEPSGGGRDPRWLRWLELTGADDLLGEVDAEE